MNRTGAAVLAAMLAAPLAASARMFGIFDCARPDRPCEATSSPGCNCHSTFPLEPNTTTAPLIIGIPTVDGYVPGREYPITVWVLGIAPNRVPLLYRGSAVPLALAGFNLEVTGGQLRKASEDDRTVQLLGTSQATHTGEESIPATLTDGNMRFSWDLVWVAPPSPAGPVIFYLAGNVVNGSSTEDGDVWSVHPTGFAVLPAPGM